MKYYTEYRSPIGTLIIAANDEAITGIWILGQKYFPYDLIDSSMRADFHPLLQQAAIWLDAYFQGKKPDCSTLKLAPMGTAFQQQVWHQLLKIPYGSTTTYGAIAKAIAADHATHYVSSQAVGNAIARNPIMIIIPCHRVINAKGDLSGYAGGIATKAQLLSHEKQIDLNQPLVFL